MIIALSSLSLPHVHFVHASRHFHIVFIASVVWYVFVCVQGFKDILPLCHSSTRSTAAVNPTGMQRSLVGL